MHAPLRGLAQRRRDRRRLQPVERRLEAVIVAHRSAATDEGEDFVGGGGHQPRRAQAFVARFDELRRCPDQHVGVPDRRHPMLGGRLDADSDLPHPEIDRGHAV